LVSGVEKRNLTELKAAVGQISSVQLQPRSAILQLLRSKLC